MFKINDKNIINNFNNEKFLKKDMRKVFKNICNHFNHNIRGYKEIDLLAKKVNGGIIFIHIGQWKEEKANNTFDYDLCIFNSNGELIYDESNGELPKYKCYNIFYNYNTIKHY